MNYEEALKYIHGTLKFGRKLGLHNMEVLLELMGNPHKKLKFVHVAGTNGKGSTVAFISQILIEAGYKTGIYTSPYLERFTERIKIDAEEIPENEVAGITEFVKEKVNIMVSKGENHPTEFEIVTALAFQYYYEKGCDMVVLEVGLGGRLDATNIIGTPLVSVITTISLDHTEWLGKTLAEIAFEKAGIIKENGNVVLYKQLSEVEAVFENICDLRKAVLKKVDFSKLELKEFDIEGQRFDYQNLKDLEISLLGEHQLHNAIVAIETIKVLIEKELKISEDDIRNGLLCARWSGRMEVLRKNPFFIIDGAHNSEAAKTLVTNLAKYFPNKKINFIFGVLRDKDYKSIIEYVAPIAECFLTVTPDSERAMPARELANILDDYCNHVYVNDTIEDAVWKSIEMSPEDGVICASGSLSYIGEIRNILNKGQL